MKYLSVSLMFFAMFGFFACTKTTDPSVVLASYTLGSGGSCSDANVTGRYVTDTALTGGNTVTIYADVTVLGPYWITTNTVNGISFGQIGTFTTTGRQAVVLTGTGIPVDTGSVSFTLTPLNGPGGSCSFSVTTIQGTPPDYRITCFFDGVYKNFSDSTQAANSSTPGSTGTPGLTINGIDTVMLNNSSVTFGVVNAGSVNRGMFSDTSTSRAYFNYVDSLGETWSVKSNTDPSFTIVLTASNSRTVQGTFSGIIRSQQGMGADSIVITDGKFIVPVK